MFVGLLTPAVLNESWKLFWSRRIQTQTNKSQWRCSQTLSPKLSIYPIIKSSTTLVLRLWIVKTPVTLSMRLDQLIPPSFLDLTLFWMSLGLLFCCLLKSLTHYLIYQQMITAMNYTVALNVNSKPTRWKNSNLTSCCTLKTISVLIA